MKVIAIDDEPLALQVLEAHCAQHEDIELVKTFTQPLQGLRYAQNFPVDLILLDIQMPSMSGLSLAKSIRPDIMVIFTTAFSNYAVTSYDLNAMDYLVKPISPERFAQAINKAKEWLNLRSQAPEQVVNEIYIRADLSLNKVLLDDILYIEGLADYVKIHLVNKRPIVSRITMKEMLDKLPESRFIRVHRSFIVPIENIKSVRNRCINLNGKEIPIGNTYYKDFMSKFNLSND